MASSGGAVSISRNAAVAIGRQVLNDGNEPDSRRGLVAAVVVLAAIVLAGLWLTGVLHGTGAVQDCVQAGRTNCAPIRTN